MNKNLSLMLPLCVVMASCAPQQPSTSFILNCPSGPAANVCPPGNQNRDKVKIQVTPSQVQVAPPIVCTDKGGTVTATVKIANGVPDPDNVEVVMVQKDADDGWILNSRTGPGDILIDVPSSTVVGTHYGYFVITSTGKCLDPMIHVDRN